jgi:hypothetical protein
MANGIASEELVIALGKENILSSFGAAGLVPERIKQAIARYDVWDAIAKTLRNI